jgi:cell division initiation protein
LKEEMVMVISPMDIHLKEFGTVSTDGYNKEEVDSFLGSVADELERLANRNKELEAMMAGMEQKVSQFDEMQQTLQNALMNAQRSAGSILQEARSQAAAIIKKAQDRSEHVLGEMKKEQSQLADAFASSRGKIEEQIPQMRELLEKSQNLLREFEEAARKAILNVPSSNPAASPASPPRPTPPVPPAPVEDVSEETDVEKAESHFESEDEKYVWE